MPPSLSPTTWPAAARSLLPQSGARENARAALELGRRHADDRREAALAVSRVPAARGRRTGDVGEQLAAVCDGIALTPEEVALARDVAPAEGFTAAAEIVLQLLQERFGMDMWMVTRTRDGMSSVLVARGVAGMPVPTGAVLPYAQTYCSRMVAGEGPRAAPRARSIPAYAASPAMDLYGVAAYVGVPLLAPDGTLFGTLCGLSSQEQPDHLVDCLPEVETVARLLSTVLAREAAALERSQAASEAYALAERDPATGLLSRRGWHSRLAVEEERCRRHSSCAGVVVVDAGGSGQAELLHRVADVVARTSRPTDTVARCGDAAVGVLAVECSARGVRALHGRLRSELRRAELPVGVGSAVRTSTCELPDAWERAADAAARWHVQQRR